MGKKKIKHLARRRRGKRSKVGLKKISSIVFGVMLIFVLSKMTDYIKELYLGKNIEEDKILYYIEVADEAGEKKTQLNWKEIMAVEMVINNEDFTKIKKAESIKLAKSFIEKEGDTYKPKEFSDVLKDLKFTSKQSTKATNNLKSLDEVYLYTNGSGVSELSKNFIRKVKDAAIDNYNEYKILPSITVAQAILESGWGKSDLSNKSNNVFGIKADSRWSGKSIEVSTTENYNDKIVDSFRVYDSFKGSIDDHGKFLTENKRYRENGLFDANTYIDQAQALEDAGYSTKIDKKGEKIYADMLIKLIRNYNLQLIDHEVRLKK